MAVKGISLGNVEEYISKLDSCKSEAEGATIFLLNRLTAAERAYISDNAVSVDRSALTGGEGSVSVKSGTQQYMALKLALGGWRQHPDESGNEIPFTTHKFVVPGTGKSKNCPDDMALNAIDPSVLAELGTHVISSNFMSEEERKNLNTA